MLSLGKLTHEIKTHQDALRELGTSYQVRVLTRQQEEEEEEDEEEGMHSSPYQGRSARWLGTVHRPRRADPYSSRGG